MSQSSNDSVFEQSQNEGIIEPDLASVAGRKIEDPRMLAEITWFNQNVIGLSPTSARRDAEESTHTWGMGDIAKCTDQGFSILAKEIEEMEPRFFRFVLGENIKSTRRYLADVFVYNDIGYLPTIIDTLCEYGSTRRSGFFGFSVEERDGHIHIIHDCSYHSGTCRDIFRERILQYGFFKSRRFTSKPVFKFTRSEWYDVFLYYFVRKSGTRKIYVLGEDCKVPDYGKSLLILYIIIQ